VTFWDYLAAHPVWGLIYLLVICVTVLACVAGVLARKDKDEKKEPESKSGPRSLMG
jgi:hypothetical protein